MKVINKYFTIWWIPIVSYLVPLMIYFFGNLMKSDDIIDGALIIFYLNILANLVSSIVQIVIKKWYFIFPQLLASSILLLYAITIFTFSPPDFYGATKTIPKNIRFERPFEREFSENDLNKSNFILTSISQPGIYNYYTNYQPKELGSFFIKAFEITSNDRLSEERMTNRSQILVENLNRQVYSGEFTIYEGSWGDKYGARIELWYKPANGNSEYKITQKNYIIEGWQR